MTGENFDHQNLPLATHKCGVTKLCPATPFQHFDSHSDPLFLPENSRTPHFAKFTILSHLLFCTSLFNFPNAILCKHPDLVSLTWLFLQSVVYSSVRSSLTHQQYPLDPGECALTTVLEIGISAGLFAVSSTCHKVLTWSSAASLCSSK